MATPHAGAESELGGSASDPLVWEESRSPILPPSKKTKQAPAKKTKQAPAKETNQSLAKRAKTSTAKRAKPPGAPPQKATPRVATAEHVAGDNPHAGSLDIDFNSERATPAPIMQPPIIK